MTLEELGFSPHFRNAFAELNDPDLAPARVVRASRDFATVHTGDRELDVRVAPWARREAHPWPVAGDWVAVDVPRELLEHVLPRSRAFVRQAAGRRVEEQVIAANVDVALILMGLDADYNLRRLERYLTLAHQSATRPVVLLTKAGLCDQREERVLEVQHIAGPVPVHAIDVVSGLEPEAARAHVTPGITAALLGSSGVGKSTLANYLLGYERVRTNPVRAHDQRGRHTTTHRELFFLPGGGALVDTPGMRELRLWADESALDETFADVAELARRCRFRDCRHDGEPGCAMKDTLSDARIEHYRALRREIDAHELRRSEHQHRAAGRRFSRQAREVLRAKGRL
jgi:ribosome biogenesis GTPase